MFQKRKSGGPLDLLIICKEEECQESWKQTSGNTNKIKHYSVRDMEGWRGNFTCCNRAEVIGGCTVPFHGACVGTLQPCPQFSQIRPDNIPSTRVDQSLHFQSLSAIHSTTLSSSQGQRGAVNGGKALEMERLVDAGRVDGILSGRIWENWGQGCTYEL